MNDTNFIITKKKYLFQKQLIMAMESLYHIWLNIKIRLYLFLAMGKYCFQNLKFLTKFRDQYNEIKIIPEKITDNAFWDLDS